VALSPVYQLREGIIYVAAPSDAAQFGQQMASALQLVEQLPNPLFLIYDYVLNIAGGEALFDTAIMTPLRKPYRIPARALFAVLRISQASPHKRNA